jgi:hypothetical protein
LRIGSHTFYAAQLADLETAGCRHLGNFDFLPLQTFGVFAVATGEPSRRGSAGDAETSIR